MSQPIPSGKPLKIDYRNARAGDFISWTNWRETKEAGVNLGIALLLFIWTPITVILTRTLNLFTREAGASIGKRVILAYSRGQLGKKAIYRWLKASIQARGVTCEFRCED